MSSEKRDRPSFLATCCHRICALAQAAWLGHGQPYSDAGARDARLARALADYVAQGPRSAQDIEILHTPRAWLPRRLR